MAFWMYAVVALGWFTGGIVGGATGMGSVMVSMPILMTVFPAGDAVLISCLCALYGSDLEHQSPQKASRKTAYDELTYIF